MKLDLVCKFRVSKLFMKEKQHFCSILLQKHAQIRKKKQTQVW